MGLDNVVFSISTSISILIHIKNGLSLSTYLSYARHIVIVDCYGYRLNWTINAVLKIFHNEEIESENAVDK